MGAIAIGSLFWLLRSLSPLSMVHPLSPFEPLSLVFGGGRGQTVAAVCCFLGRIHKLRQAKIGLFDLLPTPRQ